MRRGRPQFDKMQEESVQPKEAQNGAKPLEQQLAEAQAQVEQQRDAMLRALADAENARKRFQAEAANAQKYALERFAEALLPVIDSLEAALANPEASPQALRDGVQLTLRAMTAAMEKARVSALAPVAGRLYRGRRDPGRRAGQTAGRHQREEHHLRGEAPDRPALRRKGSAEGHPPGALQDRAGRKRRRVGGNTRQEDRTAAGLGRGAAQDEEDGRGLSRRRGQGGGDHRSGLLQRFTAPGDQGCRPHRGARREAHHQRADRGGARLRYGQAAEEGFEDRGL